MQFMAAQPAAACIMHSSSQFQPAAAYVNNAQPATYYMDTFMSPLAFISGSPSTKVECFLFYQFWMYFMKVHLQYVSHMSVSDMTCGKSFWAEAAVEDSLFDK